MLLIFKQTIAIVNPYFNGVKSKNDICLLPTKYVSLFGKILTRNDSSENSIGQLRVAMYVLRSKN
jgi:hypothetical protein